MTETEYVDELNMLKLINNKYELSNATESKCLALAKPMLRENSIEENSIEENSIYNIADKKSKKSNINMENMEMYILQMNNMRN